MMTLEEFEEIADQELARLPPAFRERIENVMIAVEEWPDRETLRLAGVKYPQELLGFYHGIPLTARGRGYNLVSPDVISLYRQPILLQCRTRSEAAMTIRRVLRHEVAHYFGIDDDRLHELGAY